LLRPSPSTFVLKVMTVCTASLPDVSSTPTGSVDRLDLAHLTLRADVRRFIARRVEPAALEDLVQEVFLKVHESAGELRDADRLGPWLFRIARNIVVDHLRKRRTRTHASLDETDEPMTPEPEINFNKEMAAWFRPMMDLLPEEYRVALELTEIEGLTQRELAERAGLSLSGAKSRVQRAKQLLEGVVRACCDFEVDVHGNFVACRPRNGGSCKSC
jgi:RNA polymerase sigma-70 factor (ECF subfamily)